VEHVRTQLPYALIAAAISAVFYLGAGFITAP
jgi:Na+/H+ antiporter NhaC